MPPSLAIPRTRGNAPARTARPPLGLALAGLLTAAALLLAGCATPAQPTSAEKAPEAPAPAAAPSAPAAPPQAAPETLPGDAASAQPATTPAEPRRAGPVTQLLAYSDRVVSLSPGELSAEIAHLTPLQDESVQRQLELALALGQTRQPVDTARALGLAQRALAQPGNSSTLQSFARMLETRFLHMRRLEDQLDRQTQQLRDAQRRNDQLNERLEAMRAIERSLNARPGGPASSGSRTHPAP